MRVWILKFLVNLFYPGRTTKVSVESGKDILITAYEDKKVIISFLELFK